MDPAPSWLVSSIGRALHRYRRGHGFKSRTGLNIFQVLFTTTRFSSVLKASNSILSFLELSRKLKQDGPDADLVEVVGKAAKALDSDPDAGLALEALPELIDQLEVRMKEAAKKLDFEDAANMRDRIKQLRKKMSGSQ